jgi:stage II sporulation protein AA (anti-sigma F factor antagonist)
MIRPTEFEIEQAGSGGDVTLTLRGELDMQAVDVLAHRVEECLLAGPAALRLDLRALGFMDSSGLRLLIQLHDRAEREAWRLALVAPEADSARMVLRVTGADAALPFEPPSAD